VDVFVGDGVGDGVGVDVFVGDGVGDGVGVDVFVGDGDGVGVDVTVTVDIGACSVSVVLFVVEVFGGVFVVVGIDLANGLAVGERSINSMGIAP
jgi:hypothetical protein